MKERMQKTLAEVKGCLQKDRTESEGYVGAQTFMRICEDNIDRSSILPHSHSCPTHVCGQVPCRCTCKVEHHQC